jgi:hypothetical protein
MKFFLSGYGDIVVLLKWFANIRRHVILECDDDMEHGLFRMLCLLGSSLSLFVIIPTNILQNISYLVDICVIVFGCLTYLLYRRSVAGQHHVKTLLVLLLLLLDTTWFLNGGTFGSVPYYFFFAFIFPLVFFRGSLRVIILAAVVCNAVAMMALEYFIPELITPFSSTHDRMIELTTGLITSGLGIILMLWIVMKSYDSEKQRLIEVNRALERSMAEITTLQGLLPICSGCKKIRDDEQNWIHIERYISENSNASFSHGMCPDCIESFYPDLFSESRKPMD